MGQTVWVLSEDQQHDLWDHSFILVEEKALVNLARECLVKPLSEFYDFSVLNEEYGGPDTEPSFFDPGQIRQSLEALIKAINDNHTSLKNSAEIHEELQDCLQKVMQAEQQNKRVRLAIIP